MATNINNKLVCNEPHASLDSYYGPYDSVHDAFVALANTTVNGVNYTKKFIGLTVGVWNSSHTEITEYWFKGGINENNLVLKTSEACLPGGVKIVTFDKNGGSGVQNSVLTDTDSQVRLPESTLTKSGDTFQKWSYNGMQKSPGEIVTIGTSTVVQAVWNSSPSPTTYTVSWTDGTNIPITGKADGITLANGGSAVQGATVVLTVNPASGYKLQNWVNKPSGATQSGNDLTFILNGNVAGISAVASAIANEFTLKFDKSGEGVISVGGTVNGVTTAVSGDKYNENSTIVLLAELEDGYTADWTGAPSDAQQLDDGKKLSFALKEDVAIVLKATKEPVSTGFSYCGLVVEGGDTNPKYFGSLEQLVKVVGSIVQIPDNKYNYLYAITNIISNPSILVGEQTYSFMPLNQCEDETIMQFYVKKGWVKEGTNQTSGDLAGIGDYIFIYNEKDKELSNQDIVISIAGR